MASTRVYILAKELGVKSSAVVKKCQDEGLDIKNHMSVISAGLAATVKEWFSEGENITTVETSEKVNLEKVRVKRKKKVKAEVSETVEATAVATEAEPERAEKETTAEDIEGDAGTAVVTEEPTPPDEQIVTIPEEPEPKPQTEPEPEPQAEPEPEPEL